MARLETHLMRTYRHIERMMHEGSDAKRIKLFYYLLHRYEKLNDRHIKVYGYSFNPVRDASASTGQVRHA